MSLAVRPRPGQLWEFSKSTGALALIMEVGTYNITYFRIPKDVYEEAPSWNCEVHISGLLKWARLISNE